MSINDYDNEYTEVNKLIRKYLKSDRTNWYRFHSQFDNQGKQGIAGVLKVKHKKCVFKTSQYFNHIIKHEYNIMKSLKDIQECCPFFTLGYGLLTHPSDFDYKYKDNIFKVDRDKHIMIDSLLMQYIDSDLDFTDFIEDEDEVFDENREHIIYSIIKQVLCALSISQKLKNFCHYDLHSSNVLLTECNKDLVILSVNNKNNCISIPTFGMMPKIIDYGFSYTKDLEDKNFYATLAHTNVGFLTCTNDFISDLKLFLVTTSYDINNSFKSETSNKFRNVVKNLFKSLDIDWEAGWDNYTHSGASDLLLSELDHLSEKSKLFDKYDHVCIDIFQSLIKLPLTEKSYDNLELSFSSFLNQFTIIEKQISSNIINLYIFRRIIDIARTIRKNYRRNPKETSVQFKSLILSLIDSIIPYFDAKLIDFETMLCSIYVFCDCVEGFLFDEVSDKIQDQNIDYKKLPLKSPLQVFACIESNIPHTYTFNDNTQLLVLDVENNSRKLIDNIHPLIQNILNKSNHLSHGKILYDYINNDLNDHILTYDHLNEITQSIEDETEPTTTIKEEPVVVEEEPIVVEEPVVIEEPVVVEESVVKEEPIVEEPAVIKEEPVIEEPKRKRGRPKKVVEEPVEEKPKRKRGRPKKVVD
tara:strand:+ start:216 stop:2135 length:1920 start_codon:yes stop_codon:yes gene_type:complete